MKNNFRFILIGSSILIISTLIIWYINKLEFLPVSDYKSNLIGEWDCSIGDEERKKYSDLSYFPYYILISESGIDEMQTFMTYDIKIEDGIKKYYVDNAKYQDAFILIRHYEYSLDGNRIIMSSKPLNYTDGVMLFPFRDKGREGVVPSNGRPIIFHWKVLAMTDKSMLLIRDDNYKYRVASENEKNLPIFNYKICNKLSKEQSSDKWHFIGTKPENRISLTQVEEIINNAESSSEDIKINESNASMPSVNQEPAKRDFIEEATQDLKFVNPSSLMVGKIDVSTISSKYAYDFVESGQFQQSFRQLMGNDFEDFWDNIRTSSLIETDQNAIYGQGMAPHSGYYKAGAFFIDDNGRLTTILVDKDIKERFKIYGASDYNQLPTKLKDFISENR